MCAPWSLAAPKVIGPWEAHATSASPCRPHRLPFTGHRICSHRPSTSCSTTHGPSVRPPAGGIGRSLEPRDGASVFVMANSGPILPAEMQDRLFDSLVSLRDGSARGAGEIPHLGLGLHVVRLVAELHHGRASAANLADA